MNKAERFFGLAACLSSFYAVIFGLGSQVYKNFQRHSVEGFSLNFFIAIFAVYSLWMAYGFAKPKKDLFLIIPNLIGLIIGLIMAWQFMTYH